MSLGARGWERLLPAFLLAAESRAGGSASGAQAPAVAEELVSSRRRRLGLWLPGVRLAHGDIYAAGELADAHLMPELALVVLRPRRRSARWLSKSLQLNPDSRMVFVSYARDPEHDTGKLMSQVLEECLLPQNRIAVLSGPNHAVEVAQRIPARRDRLGPSRTARSLCKDLFSQLSAPLAMTSQASSWGR